MLWIFEEYCYSYNGLRWLFGQHDILRNYTMTVMQRYSGEHLGLAPHIVVLGSCKVGNFVVSTPVLRGLRARFPDAVIGFIGSDVTADFERALPSLDWRCSWDDPSAGSGLRLQSNLAESANAMDPCS